MIPDEGIAVIEAVAPRGVASGDRHAPEFMRTIGRQLLPSARHVPLGPDRAAAPLHAGVPPSTRW
ncbi:hypothetical protein [Streptomyces sp. NBC_01565]|uniref:hypothetical protein n=1 Tax=Streptomyces sp. NBC_01565 TaxID=2975881 RepID=UPI0022517714|nr:hypothetical protein [Streptomyces sp. NBC_01565]MCX4546460.1 hypothetical protein [Streptomyces sp. NBC_01565]